jgi:hypothetical protein
MQQAYPPFRLEGFCISASSRYSGVLIACGKVFFVCSFRQGLRPAKGAMLLFILA